jgi:hypothetical protein
MTKALTQLGRRGFELGKLSHHPPILFGIEIGIGEIDTAFELGEHHLHPAL